MLAALLAGSLCAPSDARAGCDHRPFLGDGPGEVTLPADAVAPRDKPATPCRGPGCSRGPSRSPATPPAPAPRDLKPQGTLVRGSPFDEAGPTEHLFAPASRPPVRRAADVFRPPRPSPVVCL